jgi:ribosomal protein L20A (L18A)
MISVFRVSGETKGEKFAIDVASIDETHAIEKVYANLGSKFGAKRGEVKIEKVEKINVEDSKNRVIKQLHGEQ